MKKLDDKPKIVSNVIKFLNSKSWNELELLGFKDHMSLIMEDSKVTIENTLLQHGHNKCNLIFKSHETFMENYHKLVDQGLPSC